MRSNELFADLPGGRLRVDSEGTALVVVAIDRPTAELCLELELENATRQSSQRADMLAENARVHRVVGAQYGYPRCCVDAFCDAHTEAVIHASESETDSCVSDNALQLLRAADRTAAYHPLLRAFGQGLGDTTASPLRHMPCSFDCADSIALAEALMHDLATSNSPLHRTYETAPVADLVAQIDGTVAPGAEPLLESRAVIDLSARFPVWLPFASRAFD